SSAPAAGPIRRIAVMQENHETFTYTYSAQEQAEIRRIRGRYLPPAETPLDRLRRLERQVTRKGSTAAVRVGVAGTLRPGRGLAGIGLIAAALPLYNRITRREREKLAPLVLELTRDADPPAPPGAPRGRAKPAAKAKKICRKAPRPKTGTAKHPFREVKPASR